MARTADGEYELVVGNRHLLSVVFVLMVLFGVFFSLGYFVGRNSSSGDPAAQQTAVSSPGVSQPKEAPLELPPPAGPVAPGEAQVSAGTQPVAEPREEATPGVRPPAAQEPGQPPAAAARAGVGSPAPGETYLQVVAVKRTEAEVVVDVLRQKGFRALVAPVVVDGVASGDLYRALVGPVKDATDLARTKAELEAAGFKPIIRRY
ncbi:MAG: SPOR domain-containing protein [bacterium]|jgi:cell division septation protein DedD